MKSIYPMNPSNLQALMDYYFPYLSKGDAFKFYDELKIYNFTLEEIEGAATQILPFIDTIHKLIKCPLTQTNLLDYAVETFLLFDHTDSDYSPERMKVINFIRRRAGFIQKYDDMLSRKDNLILYGFWN